MLTSLFIGLAYSLPFFARNAVVDKVETSQKAFSFPKPHPLISPNAMPVEDVLVKAPFLMSDSTRYALNYKERSRPQVLQSEKASLESHLRKEESLLAFHSRYDVSRIDEHQSNIAHIQSDLQHINNALKLINPKE
jgi:hypothetical protein